MAVILPSQLSSHVVLTSNPLDNRQLLLTAIITIVFQFLFFLITYTLRIDKVTDFAGTTNFILLAIVTLTVGGNYHARQIVTSTCVLLWGVRLCVFLLYRILQWGEDRRFDDKRDNIVRLAFFWIFQAVWAWTVSLPVTILNSKEENSSLNGVDYLAWCLFGLGLILEATADQQKLLYKNTPQSRGRWTDVGVWAWSRHPNYFGEMLLWVGVYLGCVSDLRGAEHAAVISPIFIILLLLFVSGIPLLEVSMDKRYGKREDYVTYKKCTSVLIPFPPALYVQLPSFIKKTVLLDFKMYNPGPPTEEDAQIQNISPTNETQLLQEMHHNKGDDQGSDDQGSDDQADQE